MCSGLRAATASLVYENGGYLWLLDVASGQTRKLTVNLDFDNPNRPALLQKRQRFHSSPMTFRPRGKRALFEARGDIFTVPEKEGLTYNLTRSQGVREIYPAWSPDGKWIAYYSDASGEYEILPR